MTVAFERRSVDVRVGETTGVGFTVGNDAGADARFEVRVEPVDGGVPLGWLELEPPGRVAAVEQARGTVWVRIPPGAAPASGPHRLRVVAVHPHTRHRSSDECDVVVTAEGGRTPCAFFPEPPSFQLDADGVTATVKLANCGEADVDLRLRFRHERGWVFDVEREVTLRTDVGPVEITVRLDAGEHDIRSRDRISVEAEGQGQILTWTRGAVTASVPPRPRVRRHATVAAVAVAALGLLWGTDVLNPGSGDDPGGDPVADEVDSGGQDDGVDIDDGGDDATTPPGELDATPETLDFEEVGEGQWASGWVTLGNAGGADLVVVEVAVEGDSDAFAVHTDDCSSTTLVPDRTCEVEVAFTPAAPGFHQADLAVTGEDGETLIVPLTGEGVADDPPEILILDPEAGRYMVEDEDDKGGYVELTLFAEVDDDHDGAIEDVQWSASWDSGDESGTIAIPTGNDVAQRFHLRGSCSTTYRLTAAVTDSAGHTTEGDVEFTVWTLC